MSQMVWTKFFLKIDLPLNFKFITYLFFFPLIFSLLNLFLSSGSTSEGGGAVAFPVMTLLLKIDPKVARDFSLMIQSCG